LHSQTKLPATLNRAYNANPLVEIDPTGPIVLSKTVADALASLKIMGSIGSGPALEILDKFSKFASTVIEREVISGTATLSTTNKGTIGLNSAGGAFTITLPLASTVAPGRLFSFKDETGNCALKPVTLSSASLIDGASNFVISSNYASVTIYSTGSTWVTLSAAATLITVAPISADLNHDGRHILGTFLDFPNNGSTTNARITYTRIKLAAGTVLDRLECFLNSGESALRNINMGLYGQVDPSSNSGGPNNRIVQTGAFASNTVTSPAFFIKPISGGPITISATGYYWLAFITDTNSLTMAATAIFRQNYLPYQTQVSAGTTLPATATPVVPTIADFIFYLAVIEQGVP